MSQQFVLENKVRLKGILEGEFEYYYSLFKGEEKQQEYYMNYVLIKRGAKQQDRIPIVMEKTEIDFAQTYKNKKVEIRGKLKETNFFKNTFQYVYVKEMKVFEDSYKMQSANQVEIECILHRRETVREHRNGKFRLDFKVRYNQIRISCVAWNRNARYILDKVEQENMMRLKGVIVTRVYEKDGELNERNQFEIRDIILL